jgi:fatty-acid desaturase
MTVTGVCTAWVHTNKSKHRECDCDDHPAKSAKKKYFSFDTVPDAGREREVQHTTSKWSTQERIQRFHQDS